MFENYALDGDLGSSWEWSCMSGRRLWSQNLTERAQECKFDVMLTAIWEQVAPKMAEVATKIAILASFWELSWMILFPIIAEMGEVEKRTTVQRFSRLALLRRVLFYQASLRGVRGE